MSSKLFRVLVLAILGFSLTYLVGLTPAGARLDKLLYDQMVRLRHTLGKNPEVDDRIVILAIDEQTRQHVSEPLALWLARYAQILNAVFLSGAELVGFDIIPTYAPAELLRPFAEMAAQHPEKLVMTCFFDVDTETLVGPEQKIRLILGDENLALSNLSRDSDGIFRRQSLVDYRLGDLVFPFFARLLYERLEPNAPVPAQVIVNFAGPPGTFPTISVARVLTWIEDGNTQELEKAFRGKAVLLGGTAKADLDFVETPFPTAQPMSGVEMHANILNTLLTNQGIQERNWWWLLGLLLLPVSWFSLEKSLRLSLVFVATASISWFIFTVFAFLSNVLVIPLGVGYVGLLGTGLLGYFYRYNTVEKERRRIESTFGRYVSPDVMEAMLRVPENHRPELAKRQRVTVMFSDINDFSTACEKFEPEEVTRRLNIYFQEMTDIIYRHHGTIIRFIGDEFMVLFGAPKESDNSEEMAVLTAVRMVERLSQLKAQDPSGENGFYEVKIGIHVGEMILTSIGNETRSDFNCIGDSTNMAARVLSLAKPLGGTVLVSQAVKERVDGRPDLCFKDLGTHPVKGRAGEVQVFDVSLRSVS